MYLENTKLNTKYKILKGIIIHKILKDLERIKNKKWELYIKYCIENYNLIYNFDIKKKNKLIDILIKTTKNFRNIISAPNIFTEINIKDTSKKLNRIIRIDKIIVNKNSIKIIDFKTEKINKTKNLYLKHRTQIEKYCTILKKYFYRYKIEFNILSLYLQKIIKLHTLNKN